jgi:hypothetical protein
MASAQTDMPVDKNATTQTIRLYRNLKMALSRGIMFGHQDDLAYGVGWKEIPGKSDVKAITGDYPAVYGFELGRIEIDQQVNIDSVPFDKMKQYIREAYHRGGVITLSWHLNNPLTGKTSWDPAPGTVASILPGGSKNELYASWLDKIASFMNSLRGSRGELIPVIFRIFHEINGNWFWWGKDHCTPDEMKQLWQFTVSYLRDKKAVHNLLYAYNTDKFASRKEYLLKYPGDEWVDLIGFDIYQRGKGELHNIQFRNDTDRMLSDLEEIAKQRNKIPALTEFGFNQLPDSTWFTRVLWPALKNHNVSFALAWRNAGFKPSGEAEFYLPFKGQAAAQDFKTFYNIKKILFQKQAKALNLYR